jgi:hypothetical protein
MKRTPLSDLPVELSATVMTFREELVREREEQTRQLREAFAQLQREAELELVVMRRMNELLKSTTAL